MQIILENGAIELIGGKTLLVGDEYSSEPKQCVVLEDISGLTDKTLEAKVKELQKTCSEALEELLELSVKAYESEPMVEGEMITGEDVEAVA